MNYKIIYITLLMFTFGACSSWTKQDKDNFIEHCQKTKFNDDFCNCALDKALNKYSSFKDMTSSEKEMAELLFSCIEEDRNK